MKKVSFREGRPRSSSGRSCGGRASSSSSSSSSPSSFPTFQYHAEPVSQKSMSLKTALTPYERCNCLLESFFQQGMSWENHGRGDNAWHIDEIRPISSFDLTDEEQQKICFNWRNRQPLWGSQNLEKKDIYEPHHEVEWARRMRDLGYDGELFLLFEEGRGGL